MVLLAWLGLIVGMALAILGLGFTIRFLSYMARGVGMTFLAFVQLIGLGALSIGLGLFLILYNVPLIR